MMKIQVRFFTAALLFGLFQVSCRNSLETPYGPPAPVQITPLPTPVFFTPTTTWTATSTPTGPVPTPTPTNTPTVTPTGTLTATSTPTPSCVYWADESGMPKGRLKPGMAQANGTIYVGGGYGPQTGGTTDMALAYLESYDPQTNSWTDLSSMNSAVENPACAAFGNIVYFFGGDDGVNISGGVQGYVTTSNSWGTGNDVGFTPRTRARAAVLDNLIYVAGGYNTGISTLNGGYLGVVEAYDPVADSWTGKAGLGVAVADVGLASLNGNLYAFGGITNNGPASFMAAYNPGSNSWTYKSFLPFSGAGDGFVENGVLYAFSHVTDAVPTAPPTVYSYDPSTDSWTSHCALPNSRAGFGVVPVGNSVYAIGGSNSPSNTGLNQVGAF